MIQMKNICFCFNLYNGADVYMQTIQGPLNRKSPIVPLLQVNLILVRGFL